MRKFQPESLYFETKCFDKHKFIDKLKLIGCLHDRANIEQLARRSVVC